MGLTDHFPLGCFFSIDYHSSHDMIGIVYSVNSVISVRTETMIQTDEITSEDVRYKSQLINTHLGLSNKRIAKRIGISPRIFNSWLSGLEKIPESQYENLCQVADYAIYRIEYYRELNKNDADAKIPIETANYIDKQVGMKKYRMGETILRNLAESPKTICELKKVTGNNHRQAMSRKIQEMEEAGVIFSSRWMGHFIKCWLRQGVKAYLFGVHWRKSERRV